MEEIDIPSYFLCPISLQLMRDPVIISTGITYDRQSIEKWLFSCNNALCPVTKQPISSAAAADDSDHLIPNHNLRRLIQAWCTINSDAGVERIPTPTPPITRSQIVKLLNDAKKSDQNQLKCFHVLKSMSQNQLKRLENCGAAVEFLAGIIRNSHTFREEAVIVLFNILGDHTECSFKKIVNSENGSEFVDSITQVLNSGSSQSRACCVKMMRFVFKLVSDPIHLIGIKLEFFLEVVRVLQDKIAINDALKLLLEICPWGRNRLKAIKSGAVEALVEILIEVGVGEKRTNELCMVVLDQLCGCAEGRAAILEHGAGLAVVEKKIFRVSHEVTDRAVKILSYVSRYSGNPKVVQEMMQVGIVSKLCLVLQLDEASSKTKEMAREMLKVHSRVWKNASCVPAHLISFYPCS
ncbi:E3 ubiquitin-protein ligase PUB23-like [Impatiens glandulifera]|uniref:E3 ubiquitin-protein ligase PUB23-like n=1 Tax=Impatiens glandulifera TaxID=253017 RepID=UPI001FB06059|nr:E3 ubiquitin-protein ligase PUB23-like [Impatiens glandulifera]